MDINEIIGEGGEELGQKEQATVIRPRKRINKKIFFIFPLVVLILGVLAYLFLYKGSAPNVITGPGGKAFFPPVIPEQFISKPISVSKPAPGGVNSAPVIGNIHVNKKQGVAKAKKPETGSTNDNTLNDLFTVKYKRKAKKTGAPVNPNMPPANVPAIPFNQNLPNFNLKNMAAKINNMKGIPAGNTFNVSGYSGGYVIVECGKITKYLKAGESACGYTLLKANANDATFSRNGKFKKISY